MEIYEFIEHLFVDNADIAWPITLVLTVYLVLVLVRAVVNILRDIAHGQSKRDEHIAADNKADASDRAALIKILNETMVRMTDNIAFAVVGVRDLKDQHRDMPDHIVKAITPEFDKVRKQIAETEQAILESIAEARTPADCPLIKDTPDNEETPANHHSSSNNSPDGM